MNLYHDRKTRQQVKARGGDGRGETARGGIRETKREEIKIE